jgi:hypothetical protein
MSATLISLRIPFSSGAEARDVCVRREFLQPHFRPATTQHLLVVQAVNLCSLEHRAKIESRANAGRFSFTATGFTQASGIAPLRELKLLLDETHDQDIDSNSFSLARSTILGGDISTGTAREIEVDTVAFPTLSTHSRTSYTVEESSCRCRPEDSVFP